HGDHQPASFLAVEKDYFNSHGGIDGLYSKRTIHDVEFGDFETMEPKNYSELRANSYMFLVSKDDQLVKNEKQDLLIDNKYAPLPSSVYPYVETPRLDCDYNMDCEEAITYAPQSIITTASGKFIALAPGNPVYTYGSADL